MNRKEFDEILDDRLTFFVSNSRASEISEDEIKKDVNNIIDILNEYYNSHRRGLIELLGQRKVTNRDNKFAEYTFDDIVKKIKEFNIYRTTSQETEDHMYFIVEFRIITKITDTVLYYFGS